jgi:hypothetical protein
MSARAVGDERKDRKDRMDQSSPWQEVALQNSCDSFLVGGGCSSNALPHCRNQLVTQMYAPLFCAGAVEESRR